MRFIYLLLIFFIFSCAPYESKEIIIPDGKAIPKEIINNSKLIELHDKAFDAGRETIVFDDGETYLVQDKRLSNKKYVQTKTVTKKKTEIVYSDKFIELHDRAFDDGSKTFVYDDGKTYEVGTKRLGNKVYPKYKTYTKKTIIDSSNTKKIIKPILSCVMNTRFPIYVGC